MKLQYLTDSKGKTTGVFIPISEWKKLIHKLKGTDLENLEVPTWHIQEVRERLIDFQNHPEQALDFDQAMDAIEMNL